MRHWIGLIIVLAGAYYLWTQYGDKLGESHPPATPDVAWYLEEIDHHFSIVPERGSAWFLRGFHENKTTTYISQVTVKIFIEDGQDWSPISTHQLGVLEPEGRKTFDLPITRVPRDVEKPKLRWEVVSVRRR